jgi:hypothetical protein
MRREQQVERMRTMLIVGSLAWAVVAGGIALSALPDVNSDVRLLIGVLSVVLPLAAVVAAWCIHTGHLGWAAGLLVLSAATPTYMAFVLILVPIALALGVARLAREPHPSV